MGVVFRAPDTKLGRDAAIKSLRDRDCEWVAVSGIEIKDSETITLTVPALTGKFNLALLSRGGSVFLGDQPINELAVNPSNDHVYISGAYAQNCGAVSTNLYVIGGYSRDAAGVAVNEVFTPGPTRTDTSLPVVITIGSGAVTGGRTFTR